jgi:hypothetical protein
MVRSGRTGEIRGGRVAGRIEPVSLDSVNCPICKVSMLFLRGQNRFFDECGFESYRLTCDGCGTRFSALVDPSDDALLLP